LLAGAIVCAQPLAAQQDQLEDRLEALLVGEMAKLQVQTWPAVSAEFIGADDRPMTLEAYRGKHVLVNFWAPWCVPCREEMPQLSALQTELGGETFEVVTIAVGRNRRDTMVQFLDSIGAQNLPLHTDPTSRLSGAMGVLSLPMTVLLDHEGREVARMFGAADWASPEAFAVIRHLTED
jgi:thiol-disulfide isomerase/thioredoxin